MSLIPEDLKTEWDTYAAQFDSVTGGLAVVCSLVFYGDSSVSSNVSEDEGKKPGTYLGYGGKSYVSDTPGNPASNSTSSGNDLKQNEYTVDINGRIYDVSKDFKQDAGASINVNVWQMNSEVENITLINKCHEAILYSDNDRKQIRVRLLRPPMPYGLGNKKTKCRSFWIESGD